MESKGCCHGEESTKIDKRRRGEEIKGGIPLPWKMSHRLWVFVPPNFVLSLQVWEVWNAGDLKISRWSLSIASMQNWLILKLFRIGEWEEVQISGLVGLSYGSEPLLPGSYQIPRDHIWNRHWLTGFENISAACYFTRSFVVRYRSQTCFFL